MQSASFSQSPATTTLQQQRTAHVARIRSRFALASAVLAIALAMWIVVPAPNRTLFPLSVGAPEVCGWLILHSLFALVAGWIDRRTRRMSRVAMVFALVAFALSVSPLVRFPAASARANNALVTALGANYLDRIPEKQRSTLRSSALSIPQLFLGIPQSTVRVTRDILVATQDSVPLTMDVYQPVDAGPHPVLVQVYGGSWQRGKPSDFGEFAQYFAARGYIVFAIDYRHAPKYRFPTQLADIDLALNWIVARAGQYEADTTHMAIIGRSAGAHLAMLAAYRPESRKFRAVIDYYGPVDLMVGYENPPSPDPLDVRAIEEAFIGGPPEKKPGSYARASVNTYVDHAMPPTLLIYGARDHVVLPRFGAELTDVLRYEGTTTVHVEIPWAEHGFDEIPNGPSGQLARYVTERFLAWSMVQP